MRQGTITAGCVGLAAAVAGTAGAVTGSATLLGATPAGVALYAAVGLALPQYVGWRRTGDPAALGLAVVAAAGGVTALVAGLLGDGPFARWGLGPVEVLTFGLLGVVVVNAVGSLLAGYRATAD